MGQEQKVGRELRHKEMMYGVRCLVQKTAVERTITSICDKYGVCFLLSCLGIRYKFSPFYAIKELRKSIKYK